MAFVVIGDMLGRLGVDELRWLYPVKILSVALVLLVFWRRYYELAHWQLKLGQLLQAALLGVFVFVLWINLNADWMVMGTPIGFDPRDGGQINLFWVIVRIGGAALVVPVMEELFWRSWLMRWVVNPDFLQQSPANVSIKAFAVTAILFGVEHNQWLAGLVAGVLYAFIYIRSGSLWTAVVAHATTNALLGVWVVLTGEWAYW